MVGRCFRYPQAYPAHMECNFWETEGRGGGGKKNQDQVETAKLKPSNVRWRVLHPSPLTVYAVLTTQFIEIRNDSDSECSRVQERQYLKPAPFVLLEHILVLLVCCLLAFLYCN